MRWPDWWQWELEFTAHLEKRMVQRSFNETGLREMLFRALKYRADVVPGRYVIETHFQDQDWQVIVEPDSEEQALVVITAYPVTR